MKYRIITCTNGSETWFEAQYKFGWFWRWLTNKSWSCGNQVNSRITTCYRHRSTTGTLEEMEELCRRHTNSKKSERVMRTVYEDITF